MSAKRCDQRAVRREGEVRDRDDERGALLLQSRQISPGGVERVVDARVGELAAADFARVEAEADEADLHAVHVLHHVRRGAADCGARARVDHVRDDPLPARLAHALNEHVVAEVELVVAERRQIETRGVERGDHLLASEHARGDRRREEIAGEDEQRRAAALRRDLPLQRRHAREAPCAVDRRRLVHVVDLEKGNRGTRARRRRRLRDLRGDGADERRDEGGSCQTAANHCDTWARSTFPPLSTTPTRAPRMSVVPSIAAAAPSAPVGSTMIFSRSQR